MTIYHHCDVHDDIKLTHCCIITQEYSVIVINYTWSVQVLLHIGNHYDSNGLQCGDIIILFQKRAGVPIGKVGGDSKHVA